jgi:hypothetical protein
MQEVHEAQEMFKMFMGHRRCRSYRYMSCGKCNRISQANEAMRYSMYLPLH